MTPILVLHGPNLNLLGTREPEIYGEMNLETLNEWLTVLGKPLGLDVQTFQSNHEGALIDRLQEARNTTKGVIFNPAGYTHTSVALRDAVAAIQIPVIEVHLSNVQAREPFRRVSLLSEVCIGTISGFGWRSYAVALHALKQVFEDGS